jgi:hypothetical protein
MSAIGRSSSTTRILPNIHITAFRFSEAILLLSYHNEG